MLLAFSLSLQQYVSAAEADYEDCTLFQMICPACHEPIFKVGNEKSYRQYFAHYRDRGTDEERCELRVAAITQEQISAQEIIGRGQTLAEYFKHFETLKICRSFPCKNQEDLDRYRRLINQVRYRPTFQQWCEAMRDSLKSHVLSAAFKERAKQILTNPVNGEKRQSNLQIRTHLAFLDEFLPHMFAANSLPRFVFFLAVEVAHLNYNWDDVMAHAPSDSAREYHQSSRELIRAAAAGDDRRFKSLVRQQVEPFRHACESMVMGAILDTDVTLLFELLADCRKHNVHPDKAITRMMDNTRRYLLKGA